MSSRELAEYLKSQGYGITLTGSQSLVIEHPSLPIYLHLEFKDNLVYVSIGLNRDELREVLGEIRESGEDVEEVVEDALSYLNNASLKARKWLEERGYTAVFKIREGSIEIYEVLEEVLEEAAE
ncbi:MAG: hypothetical protein ACP5KA_03830 [Desulfurococcaceae archaeon]